MATLDPVDVGSAADDGTGDPLRTAFQKINADMGLVNAEIIDLTSSLSTHTHTAESIVSGVFDDALVAQSNVKQHEDALSIAGEQVDSGTIPDARLANTAVTPGSYTNLDCTIDAKGRITAASNGSSTDAAPTQVASNADPFSLTDARCEHLNVEIVSHQANVVFEIPAAAAAGRKWFIRPKHDGCTVQTNGDVGSINGTAGGSARLVNGSVAVAMVDSNAGSAPVGLVIGNGVIMAPTAVSGAKTYDNDDHGQDFEITTAGTQTMPTAASAIDGLWFNIFNTSGSNATIDGADADVTLGDDEVITVKKLGTSLWAFGSGGVVVLDAA